MGVRKKIKKPPSDYRDQSWAKGLYRRPNGRFFWRRQVDGDRGPKFLKTRNLNRAITEATRLNESIEDKGLSIAEVVNTRSRPFEEVAEHYIASSQLRDPTVKRYGAHIRKVGVIVFDPTSFPKKGTHSVGVKRQWCPDGPLHRRSGPVAPSRWKRFKVRDGEKGAIEIEAVEARVRTKYEQRIGPQERLIVIRSVGGDPRVWYTLSNAPSDVPLSEPVRVHAERHRIKQVFEEAKGETGLAHYEVRSWTGWHHHMTLSLLALWFVTTETRRLGGAIPRGDGAAGAAGLLKAVS